MEKKELRAYIKTLKKQHTKEQLLEQSEKILAKLEQHPDFIKAEKVMLYSALPDEVQTQAFLEKWHLKKTIILPTVVGDDIIVPQQPEIIEGIDYYYVRPYPLATSWKAEGGVILESTGNNVKVAWFGNAPKHSLTASTLLPHGLGLNTTKIIN